METLVLLLSERISFDASKLDSRASGLVTADELKEELGDGTLDTATASQPLEADEKPSVEPIREAEAAGNKAGKHRARAGENKTAIQKGGPPRASPRNSNR